MTTASTHSGASPHRRSRLVGAVNREERKTERPSGPVRRRTKAETMRVIHCSARLAAAAILLLVVVAPASAVVGGTSDTANRFANVGVLQLNLGGGFFDLCSGTLVRPDVVLTAAHCTDIGGPGAVQPDSLRVSFDPAGSSGFHAVDRVVVNPDWVAAGGSSTCVGNSKQLCLDPPHQDIALLFLKDDVAAVTPAPIAPAGYLDGLDLKSAQFTVVGYGIDAFFTGSIFSRKPSGVDDGIRSFAEVTAIPAQDAFPDRFVKLTSSLCFGDSGGPLFHDGTIVAINTWSNSPRCSGPDLDYRVDSAPAQAFLAANL
jgi:trypsin